MATIHYWRDYLKSDNNNVNTNNYLLTFFIHNKKNNSCNTKFYFSDKTVDIVRFVKYVALPSFTYSNIKSDKEDIIIEAVDYREMLNFFTISDHYYNKELIKKYSYFFNKLEEFEYSEFNECEFESICNEINKYFSIDDKLMASVKFYNNFSSLKIDVNKKLNDCTLIDDNKNIIDIIKLIETNNVFSDVY